ncbi:MAG TPA: AAA family ATPase [Euzebyales bacterium]|nr:AAA family ATPase [Euzebyales bacterium]
MIERLQLRRWRAFERLDLVLEPGTTFVVAPNGVGKTSLLLGMAWAVFGDQAKVDARDHIRAGADSAEAEVTMRLDGDRLVIRRTVAERGRSVAEHELNGAGIGERALQSLLRDAFGAQPAVAAQLAMMMGGGHVASERALDLEDHLYDAFGITALRAAAEHSAALARAAARQRGDVRSVAKLDLADRAAKEAELAQLDRTIAERHEQRDRLAAALDEAYAARGLATQWSRHDTEVAGYERVLAAVMRTAGDLGLDGDAEQLVAAVDAALAGASAALADVSEHITDARARARSAGNALALLQTDTPSCPTCLRPFHGGELADAVRAHQADADEATREEADRRATAATIEGRMARLAELRQALAAVPAAPVAPVSGRPEGDAGAMVDAALAALREHDTQSGRLEHERDRIRLTLADDAELRRAQDAQRRAYRREAVTGAVAAALSDAAEQLTRGYIEPLSQQIRWRWKLLFGEEGLQLKPDGTIVRIVGDRELPWDSLSGGERIWARLVTHLLVLATSTRLSFACFDEPLEHLDPRTRRAVAAALATATRTGGPRQLIVTTYEHAIARQLAADVPEASIRYVRRTVTR